MLLVTGWVNAQIAWNDPTLTVSGTDYYVIEETNTSTATLREQLNVEFPPPPCDYTLPGAGGFRLNSITVNLPFPSNSWDHNQLVREATSQRYRLTVHRRAGAGSVEIYDSGYDDVLSDFNNFSMHNLAYGEYTINIYALSWTAEDPYAPYPKVYGGIRFSIDSCYTKNVNVELNKTRSNLITFYTPEPNNGFGIKGYGNRRSRYCREENMPAPGCLEDTVSTYTRTIDGNNYHYTYATGNAVARWYFMTTIGPIGFPIPSGASFDPNVSRIRISPYRLRGNTSGGGGNHYHYTYDYTWVYDYPIPPFTNDEIMEATFPQ